MTILTAENLHFSFGKVTALDGVNLAVEKGEIFGIVGPDGAGKTTLIRIFCGLLPPTAGWCRVLGYDTVRDKRLLIQKIGYLSQRFSLYTDLTVRENITFFAEIHGVRNYREKREELLRSLGLDHCGDRLAGALSGGMQQKLALACTLIHTPEVIFLDEPTNGVDPVARREFWDILTTIAARGVSILISTPYLDEAERCHRLAFMDHGSVIAVATPREAKERFPGLLFAAVCQPARDGYAVARRLPEVVTAYLCGEVLHLELSPTANPSAVQRALAGQVALQEFHPIAPTIEDVFIGLLAEKRKAS